MAIQFSQRLKVYMLGTSAGGGADASLRTVWSIASDYFGLILCSGTVPATPETAVAVGQVVATFPTGKLNFGDASYLTAYGNVVLPGKTMTDWTTTATLTGVVSFFRIYDYNLSADNGYAADTNLLPRIQGTVGSSSGFDLVMTETSVASGQTITIDTFNIILF